MLAADQVTLSNHFAKQHDDKFADVVFDNGAGDAPLLDGCAARFQCKKSYTHEGGDHLIIVGEVIQFDNTGRPGLLYHEGRYAVSEAHPVAEAKQAEQRARGGFADDYLDYLLAHASAKFQRNFQPLIDKAGLTHYQWRILASLSGPRRPGYFRAFRDDPDSWGTNGEATQHMDRSGLIASRIDEWDANKERYFLTDQGRTRIVGLLAAAKGTKPMRWVNSTPTRRGALKDALKRLIRWVDTASKPIGK